MIYQYCAAKQMNKKSMEFEAKIKNNDSTVSTNETGLLIVTGQSEERIEFRDVITIESTENGVARLHHIKSHPYPDHKLSKEIIEFTCDQERIEQLKSVIKDRIDKDTERPKKVAIFVNPIGGKGKGRQICQKQVVPLLELAGIQTDVVVSERAGHFKDLTESYDFNSVDGIVIMGGDGTVSEIINVLMRKKQKEAEVDIDDSQAEAQRLNIPVAVIPTGSACGVVRIAHGVNDVMTSTLHIIKGKTAYYNTLGCFNKNKLIGYGVICYGYVMYADMMYDIDNHFRWMKTLRYLFVPFSYLLIKRFREVQVDITYEYLKGSEPDYLTGTEKETLSVTRRKTLVNIVGTVDDLQWSDFPYDQQPERKNQFQLLDYIPCGKLEMIKHMGSLTRLTNEHLEAVKHFCTFSRVKAFHIKATEENSPSQSEKNLRFNIDGETHNIESPDVYVRLFPNTLTVYSSYEGSRRWQ